MIVRIASIGLPVSAGDAYASVRAFFDQPEDWRRKWDLVKSGNHLKINGNADYVFKLIGATGTPDREYYAFHPMPYSDCQRGPAFEAVPHRWQAFGLLVEH